MQTGGYENSRNFNRHSSDFYLSIRIGRVVTFTYSAHQPFEVFIFFVNLAVFIRASRLADNLSPPVSQLPDDLHLQFAFRVNNVGNLEAIAFRELTVNEFEL